MTDDARKLRDILQGIIESFKDDKDISPSVLATAALLKLDPEKKTIPIIYIAAHLELRQISRQILAGHQDRRDDYEYLLLEDGLQDRYPIARKKDEEPLYRKRNELTDADKEFTLMALSKKAAGYQRHYDLFAAWCKREDERKRLLNIQDDRPTV